MYLLNKDSRQARIQPLLPGGCNATTPCFHIGSLAATNLIIAPVCSGVKEN
jgi:hypothetical protein